MARQSRYAWFMVFSFVYYNNFFFLSSWMVFWMNHTRNAHFMIVGTKMTARTMLIPAMVYIILATVSKSSMLAPLVLFVLVILVFAGKSYVGDFPGIKDVFHVFVVEVDPFVVVGVMHVDVAVFFFEDKHVVKLDRVF